MYRIYGPYIRKDGRKHIVFTKRYSGASLTYSYSKYKLEIKLGRKLTLDETCDHKDDDITNDNWDNLQVLIRSENIKKAKLGNNWKKKPGVA